MDINKLLKEVIAESKALGIPVSDRISPEVVINSRAKTRFGCCKRTAQGYVIELSDRAVAAGEAVCREILAHEILHSCPGCINHQVRWKHYAGMMKQAYGYDIRTTRKCADLGVESGYQARYRLKCERCGAVLERMKKSSLIKSYWRYRCRCGGKLKPF